MKKLLTIGVLTAGAMFLQSCNTTTEVVEVQPVVVKKTPKPKPKPKPRTPTPAETTVVNQYD